MIYFTSDPHYWHRNIIKFCDRPFASVEEMNEALINNWNKVVKPQDEVIILGDMFFCGYKALAAIMQRLNGKKHLIRGNHDWGKIKPHRTDLGFESILDQSSIKIGLYTILLNHFPYAGDHTTDVRYLDKRPEDTGGWLLHGHVHNAWKVNGRQINVGVDVWDYTPVSIDQIAEVINEEYVKQL